jgi:hypothetical protein
MIYSELVRLCELDSQLEEKYGKTIFNLNTREEIGWGTVVAVIRFGQEYKTHPSFLKECGSFGHLNEDVFSIREDLLKKLPNWLIHMRVINSPIKIITIDEEIESMKKNKEKFIKQLGESKYNELFQKLIDYKEKKNS